MNHDLELDIKKKVKRLEHDIDEIKTKYNKDMIDISIESDKLLQLNQAETERLNELEIKIKELEKEELLMKNYWRNKKRSGIKRLCEEAAL